MMPLPLHSDERLSRVQLSATLTEIQHVVGEVVFRLKPIHLIDF